MRIIGSMGSRPKDIEPSWERVFELIAKNGAMTSRAIAPHFGMTHQGIDGMVEKAIAKIRAAAGIPTLGGKWKHWDGRYK